MQLSETNQTTSYRQFAGQPHKFSNKLKKTGKPSQQANKINTLLSQLRIKTKSSIQMYVKSKSIKFIEDYRIDFTKINSLHELKYIIFRMLEGHTQNIEPLPKSLSGYNNCQTNIINPSACKKTNIYIDFDFTQLIEKADFELNQKEHIIEKLQDMMIDKDNEIDILQDENQEMRRQIQQIAAKNYNDKTFHENEKLHFQGKTKGIEEENKKLKDEIKVLSKDITALQCENKYHPDEFLRRCLLTQAISIEHFLKNTQES